MNTGNFGLQLLTNICLGNIRQGFFVSAREMYRGVPRPSR